MHRTWAAQRRAAADGDPVLHQICGFITDFARASGATVVIAEQMATIALKVADHGYALRRGRMVLAGSGAELQGGGLAATYL